MLSAAWNEVEVHQIPAICSWIDRLVEDDEAIWVLDLLKSSGDTKSVLMSIPSVEGYRQRSCRSV